MCVTCRNRLRQVTQCCRHMEPLEVSLECAVILDNHRSSKKNDPKTAKQAFQRNKTQRVL
eukprot:1559380-Amphidinium_carterae.1